MNYELLSRYRSASVSTASRGTFKMAIYDDLKATYPTQSKAELYNQMGGEWPTLVDHPNYRNTCAIRLSMALHGAGYGIADKYREGMTGDGRAIIIKVKTMWDYVTETVGPFTWGMSKNPGTPVDIPVRQGIIVYHAAFSDATGHFDLWTGTGFVGNGSLADVKDGFDLALWY
jgi:hypothetical protein